MGYYNINIVKNILIPFLSSDGEEIKVIYTCQKQPQLLNLDPNSFIVSMSSYVKNLKAYSKITSLPIVSSPNYLIGDSDTTRLTKALQAEWNSARIHLQLHTKIGINNWLQMGEISLVNYENYPFKVHSLLDIFTDGLATELGESSFIGANLKDVNYGLLGINDIFTIHGTATDEYVIFEKELYQIGGDTMPSTIDASAIVSGVINSARLPIGSGVQASSTILNVIANTNENTSTKSTLFWNGTIYVPRAITANDLPQKLANIQNTNPQPNEAIFWNGSSFITRTITPEDLPPSDTPAGTGTEIQFLNSAPHHENQDASVNNKLVVSYWDEIPGERWVIYCSKDGYWRPAFADTVIGRVDPRNSRIPDKAGQVWVNVNDNTAYIATGINSADWRQITLTV